MFVAEQNVTYVQTMLMWLTGCQQLNLQNFQKFSIKVRYKNLSIKGDFYETQVREGHTFGA